VPTKGSWLARFVINLAPFMSRPFPENPPVSRGSAGPCSVAFDDVYRESFAFVFRNVKRLGVHESAVDDVVQEVFMVVHRRLADYDGRAPIKAWVYGIVSRVVSDHRRRWRRKASLVEPPPEDWASPAPPSLEPNRMAEQRERARLCLRLLDGLDDDKREVLVLVELEQMTVPEIAAAIGANINTVYSRLKAARREFAELHARENLRFGKRSA
jgi:RNA polymerase sigma-70 factor, ECF subfamily